LQIIGLQLLRDRSSTLKSPALNHQNQYLQVLWEEQNIKNRTNWFAGFKHFSRWNSYRI